MKLKNQKGMTLTEVVVAIGLLGGVSLGVSHLLKNQANSNKTAEIKSEYDEVVAQIRNILSDPKSCRETFLGRDASLSSGGGVSEIKYKYDSIKPPKSLFPVGIKKQSMGLVGIERYSFETMDPADSAVQIAAGQDTGVVNLAIHFDFDNRKQGGAKVIRKIRLNVVTNSTTDRKIRECAASAASVDFDARYLKKVGGTMVGDIVMSEGTQIVFESDRKLKKDISKIREPMSGLNNIRPVSYTWEENGDKVFGVLSQEVYSEFPEAVKQSSDGRLYVDYAQLNSLLLAGIQELGKENKDIKLKINILKQNMESIKSKICKKDFNNPTCRKFR